MTSPLPKTYMVRTRICDPSQVTLHGEAGWFISMNAINAATPGGGYGAVSRGKGTDVNGQKYM